MVFSQYVIDAFSSANQFGSEHNYNASRLLVDAATNTEDSYDAHILKTVGGVLSMSYNSDKQEFLPLVVWHDGQRSFSIVDIKQEDIEILEKTVDIVGASWIRAQLSHVIWCLSNNYRFAQQAVDSYLALFDETFDPSHWVDCYDAVRCAYHIASSLGKTADTFKRTLDAVNQKLEFMNGTDPLFLSLSLIKLVIKDVPSTQAEKHLQIVTKLAEKNLVADNPNTSLADETYTVQELLLRRLNKADDRKVAKGRYALYYEKQAEALSAKNDYFRAVIMLKKACVLYGDIDRSKVLDLRLKLESFQRESLKYMQSVPFEINVKPIYESIEKLFDGLSQKEALVQLSRLISFYKVDEVKTQLFKEQKEFVFSSLFSSSLMNENGQTVQELPPLSEAEANSNPELLHKHLVRHVSKRQSISGSVILGIAFDFVQKTGPFPEDIFDFLVNNNAIIPEGREDIIREGLNLSLTGKLYAGMHILLPQTENIFRNLVKMCGDTVTFLKEDGTEEYKPLSQLFKSEKLRDCYSEDIIFTFQSVMDEPIGENLRNLNAHGVLEPQKGNGDAALYFLCLLIKLLAMYSVDARPILKSLVERDPKDKST